MASTTQRTADVRINVDTNEASKRLEELGEKTTKLRKQFAEAYKKGDTKAIEQIRRELDKTNRESARLRTNAQNIAAAMKSLDRSTPKELQRVIKMINAELNSGRVQRGTKEWDAYIKKLHETQAELSRVRTEMSGVSKTQEGMFSRFAGVFTKWWGTYTILTDAIGGVNMKLADMKKQFRDKDAAQANLKALTGLDDESILWLTKQAETLSKTMDETGLRVTQSSKEILEAYMLVGSNKPELLTDKEALNAVTIETMRLSSAAQMDLKPAVDATTTALNQYGAGADQAAKYVNVLAAGSKMGSANVEQQAASILRAGTAAASANVPIEKLVGSIETLAEKGVKGEVAGTGLKKFFLVLQTGAAETNPKVVGLATAVENLKKQVDAAEKKSVGGGASFLKKMFGEEGFSIASIITSNIDKLQSYTDAVTGTSIAMEQAAINSNTLAASKAQLKNKLTEAGNVLIEKLNPSLGILVQWQSKLIGSLPELISFLVKYRTTLTTIATAWLVYAVYVNKAVIADKLKYIWSERLIGSLKRLFLIAKANPWGAIITGGAILLALFLDLTKSSRKLTLAQESVNKVRKDALSNIEQEKIKLTELRRAATDENTALSKRKRAIEELNKIIPEYNGKLDETTGKYEENKTALDKYLSSLTKQYEIAGAKEYLEKLGKEYAKLKIEEREAMKEVEAATKEQERIASLNSNANPLNHISSTGTGSGSAMASTAASASLTGYEQKLESIRDKIKDVADARQRLFDVWGADIYDTETKTETPKKTDSESEVPRNAETGEELNALKKQKDAMEAELKAALDEQKKLYSQSVADAISRYSTGDKDYREYLKLMADADAAYIAGRKKVYEDAGKQDSAEYANLLKQEEDLKAKHSAKMKALDDRDLQWERDRQSDKATMSYFDPADKDFQNDKVLKQKLLRADIDYLEKKKELYKDNAEEREKIELEIQKRLDADKLDKQKELAEAYARYSSSYSKERAEMQKQTELSLLDELHRLELISEEEYQRGRAKVERDFRKAALKERKDELLEGYDPANEFDAMVADIYTSFTMLFENLDTSSEDFWERFSAAAQASLQFVSAGLQQLSGYVNACQQADIAAIEARYDREIELAGKNTAKASKLEKEKQKEVAKTKKKYNDRAMKMEIAQAIAQTAANALGAYGAMVKIPVVGPALAAAAAAMATAAGMIQIATIKKQHEAQAQGYYDGGFTPRDPNKRKEVGVVHANEFVANHKAVSNPAIAPVLQLIDQAQKSNTVGSLTADDVTNALGRNQGVSARGEASVDNATREQVAEALSMIAGVTASSRQSLDRLSSLIEEGLPAYMVMDGEDGFDNQYKRYKKSIQRTKP
ncbi:MAG: phage tail tape measure protein [Bacteroides sp.]|nr:phage tail tape measure protein [Bacteroides sp.]MCM1390768.1 phage tail tape measure protein [Bacteroides sp.]